MRTRRTLVKSSLIGGIAIASRPATISLARRATPEGAEEAVWLEGNSVWNDFPEDAVADPDSVQIVRVSPVLYEELAIILIHNAKTMPVMIRNVRGTLNSTALPSPKEDFFAYNIPPVTLPPGEYWIGKLKIPTEVEVGADIEFEAEVNLHSDLADARGINALLPAIAPAEAFELPDEGESWPIRYENNLPYRTARLVQYQHIFFDKDGEICGYLNSDDRTDPSGVAEFRMRLTNSPQMSTGGAVVGEQSDRWLAQWHHAPGDSWFADFPI